MLQVLHKLEQYLPLLENFIFHVDKVSYNFKIVQWASDLKIRWTSALISSSCFKLRGPNFFQMDNLRFELGMTIFLYGATLRQRALELLSAGRYLCFSFTLQFYISMAMDVFTWLFSLYFIDLVKSTTLFREAAGVYHHLAHEILPTLQPSLDVERPPEVVSSLSSVMRLVCLADAQVSI